MTDNTAASAEPYVGKELRTRSFRVREATLKSHYEGLGLPRPEESDGTSLIPSMVASEPDGNYFNEIAFSNHIGHLWMRQEWELFAPMKMGQDYESTGTIRDIYEKRDRNVVQYAVELRDASGNLVLRTQHHQSFLLDRQSQDVKFRDPKAKPGARKFIMPDGDLPTRFSNI